MQTQRLKNVFSHIASAFICIAAALANAACTQAVATAEQPLTRGEIGAQRSCESGYVVEWISKTEMQCLKELAPNEKDL